MSIRLGLYDFFAYTLPGSLYVLLIARLASLLGLITFDFQQLGGASLLQIFLLAATAYVAGLLVEPIAKYWRRLLGARGLAKSAHAEFTQRHSNLKTEFRPGDWGLLLASIRRESIELASGIEQLNVTGLMLGNISFGLFLWAILQLFESILAGSFNIHLGLFIILIIFSTIAGRECVKYRKWFYLSIFDAVAARELSLPNRDSPKQPSTPHEELEIEELSP